MLRASVERDSSAVALVELGGRSLSYGELWDGAARVAGGLREQDIERGDRVAIRLGNGADWVLAFFGAQLLGAVVVPVNTRFTEDEVAYVVEDSGAAFTFAPGASLPDGKPVAVDDPRSRRARRDLLHERHDWLSEGRDDHARQLHDQQRELLPGPLRRALRAADDVHARIRAPVPRDRLQQPAAAGARVGARVEILSSPARHRRFFEAVGAHGVNQLVSVPAIYHAVMRHPALRRARRQPRALDLLRRRADRREPRACDPGGVPQRARGKRLRPHGDPRR